ncbi:hypothetical protein C3408_22535 [Candidatus Pantoea alvi]|nr:hypothetical protein C3408_22535 [Pantoea alvi]
MSTTETLATGSRLTPETFADFITRLEYHARGEGVNDHCTADAIFNVEQKRIVTGIDTDYTDDLIVICHEHEWFSPVDYWKDAGTSLRKKLNAKARLLTDGDTFLKATPKVQWDVLSELEDHTVTGYAEEWRYVNSHFTREAAEAYIKRKRHDYRELRIYVDANIYCWEFNAIKEALMDGRLVLVEKPQ